VIQTELHRFLLYSSELLKGTWKNESKSNINFENFPVTMHSLILNDMFDGPGL